jgi:glycosyltransferase involved in cell wall biosynthesis
MKVCMLVATDMSHDARVWKEARTLARQGHEVTVLAGYNPALPEDEAHDGVRVIRVAPRWAWRRRPTPTAANEAGQQTGPANGHAASAEPGRLRRWLWAARTSLAGLSWVARLDPDVVHVHDADRLLLGGFAQRLLNKPLVYDSHEYFPGLLVDDSLGWRLFQRWLVALEHLFAPGARAVITVNDAIGLRMRRRYRVRDLTILHNFPHRQVPPADRRLLRGHLPPEYRERPLLLYQGRLTAHRGIEVFVETVARVPHAAGVIVGGGPMEAAFKALAAERGLVGRLAFVPQVPWEELAAYTAGADLGFCLSQNTCENNYLALPNKLFEYLMVGVPVVVSDYPVLRKYVVGEEVGVVIPPDDPARIATVIGELLQHPGRLAAMHQNALRVSQTKYNWESQEDVLASLYRRLAHRRGKTQCRP